MTAGLRLYGLEVRRSLAVRLLPLLAGLAWYAGRERDHDGVALWPEASHDIGMGAVLLAPAVGGLAAWAAGRDRRRGMDELLATTPRPPEVRDLTNWAGTATGGALAYLAAALYVGAVTARDATWGGPVPAPILLGLAAVAACAMVGFAAGALVGRYLPSRLVAALVPVVLFVALMVPGTVYDRIPAPDGGYSSDPAPVRHLSPWVAIEQAAGSVFARPDWSLAALGSLWLLGLGGAALAAVVLRRRRSGAGWGALAAAGATAALAAGLLLRPDAPGDWSADRPLAYEPACAQAAVPVCLHPAYESVLDETAAIVDGLVRPLVGIPGAPVRAEERPYTGPASRPDGTLVISAYHPGNGGATEAHNLAVSLVEDPASDWGLSQAQAAVAVWLLRQAGWDPAGSPIGLHPLIHQTSADGSTWEDLGAAEAAILAAADRFAALEPAGQRAWLEANFAALRAERLTLEDLP